MKYIFLSTLLILINLNIYAQHLKPGFDKDEFIELLNIGAHTTTNKKYYDSFKLADKYSLLYQSAQIGLDNLWQLYISTDSVAVISIRGTTATSLSFLTNFYAAMVPAKGTLNLDKDFSFTYNLSDNVQSAVHTGFLISTAYLARDIIPKIDSLYNNMGIREFIIAGHSQGGAITYLLTSHFENLKTTGQLPKDIRFKTCTSASPKPGNLFYAYDYENLTYGGWAYNVVNTADWVPEAPFTVQKINDYNFKNPFKNAKSLIRKQKFPANIVLRYVYGRLTTPSFKAQKNYEKFLGKMISKKIKKSLPEFIPPTYFKSSNYVRTGTTIILYADSSFYKAFPENKNDIWQYHTQKSYLYLANKLPENKITN